MKKKPTLAELKIQALKVSQGGSNTDDIFSFMLFIGSYTTAEIAPKLVKEFNRMQEIDPTFDISIDSVSREGFRPFGDKNGASD